MNRALQYVNFFGILALAALCVLQWRAHRRLNLELNRLERAGFEQRATLREQAEQLRGQNGDLEGFREHLDRLNRQLGETSEKLAAAERLGRQLAVERDQLKSSVTNWATAVAVREQQLQRASEQLKLLAGERNEAVKQFNDLATRHNKLVHDWNEQQSRLTNGSAGGR